jgi:hypothetical protein
MGTKSTDAGSTWWRASSPPPPPHPEANTRASAISSFANAGRIHDGRSIAANRRHRGGFEVRFHVHSLHRRI